MMQVIIEFSVALLPMVIFLLTMWYLDTFQLIKKKFLLSTVVIGCITAGLATLVNDFITIHYSVDRLTLSRFIAPFTEEFLKLIPILLLFRQRRIGFMIDSAILGFAIGVGFALIENIFYLSVLNNTSLITWFVRGFGTAIMHGGVTSIADIILKIISDTKSWNIFFTFLFGYLSAVIIHAVYNLFLLPPITTAIITILSLPIIYYVIFNKSEEFTRSWLGVGLDNDMELLKLLMAGNISETRVGKYISTIQNSFQPLVVGDIICYLRIYLELSVKAKGLLILKDSGIELEPDTSTIAQFKELEYLETQIGKTGKLAIQPLLNLKDTDLWQLTLIK